MSFKACPIRFFASAMLLSHGGMVSSGIFSFFMTIPNLLPRCSAMSSIYLTILHACFQAVTHPLLQYCVLLLMKCLHFLHSSYCCQQQAWGSLVYHAEKIARQKAEVLSLLLLETVAKVSMVGPIIFTTFPWVLYKQTETVSDSDSRLIQHTIDTYLFCH